MSLIQNIKNLQAIQALSKYEHVVHGIIESVEKRELNIGDKIPSINKLHIELGYAKQTIIQGYDDLKQRGILRSVPIKGYFIASRDTKINHRLVLVFHSFNRSQKKFYDEIRRQLGNGFHFDIFFHHNIIENFESILYRIKEARYHYHVIEPLQCPSMGKFIESFNYEKAFIINNCFPMNFEVPSYTQDLDYTTYKQLKTFLAKIKKGPKWILVVDEESSYTISVLKAFNRFIEDFEIFGRIVENHSLMEIEISHHYLFLNNNSLYKFLKYAETKWFIGVGDLKLSMIGVDNLVEEFRKQSFSNENFAYEIASSIRKSLGSTAVLS